MQHNFQLVSGNYLQVLQCKYRKYLLLKNKVSLNSDKNFQTRLFAANYNFVVLNPTFSCWI